jgi:hypothetical protein
MHTKDLALALRVFADVADIERAQDLYDFAAFLERGRNETISARIKRLSPSSRYPARLQSSLSTIAEALRAAGAIRASAKVHEVLTVFKGRPGSTIEAFLLEISVAPVQQWESARRFKTLDADLAEELLSKLLPQRRDFEAFTTLIEELETTSGAGTATWGRVASRITGSNHVYRDRRAAVRAIIKHVDTANLLSRPG